MSQQKMYILLVDDKLASYIPSINKAISTNCRASWSCSRYSSPKVSKLNHSIMNKRTRKSNTVLPRKKTVTRKRKMDLLVNPSYRSKNFVIK